MVVFTDVTKEDLDKLSKRSFKEEEIKTIYEEVRIKGKGVVMILYTSGKLLIQGKKDAIEEVTEIFHKIGIGKITKSEKFRKQKGEFIGSDESLKGDTFGGLVVAAVKADDHVREKLIEIGVADSKKLSDKEIIRMAEIIKRVAPCDIRSILPEEYNHHQKSTIMLNKLHKETAKFLKPGTHVVDKYPGCRVGDIKEIKAESKYVEVAAASILARAGALEQLNYLSSQAGFNLPKGSTHVKLALMELKERGKDFRKFVKIDFNNVKEFIK